MTSKELINKTFDRVIEKIKKERIVGAHCETQVWDEALDIQTDKNITEICKIKQPIKSDNLKIVRGDKRVSEKPVS